MEEQEFLVSFNRQIAIKATSQEEAYKKVLNGEGKIANSSLSASLRPQPNQAQGNIRTGLTTQIPPK